MENPPLLFVSGLSSNEAVWSHVIKNLGGAEAIKVVSPNQDSSSKMVEEILEKAPKKFVLIGHSMGGWLSLEVMKKAKERVSKLCLINTTAHSDTPSKKNKRKEWVDRVEKGYFKEVVKEMVDLLVFNPPIKNEVEKMFLAVGEQAFMRQEKAMLLREECESVLPTIPCPTLVIHAVQDKVFSFEDHQYLVHNIPQAKLISVEQCGHMSPLEKPQELASLLSAWLKS